MEKIQLETEYRMMLSSVQKDKKISEHQRLLLIGFGTRVEQFENCYLYNISNQRKLLIAYELKMRSCTDEQAETMVDSYLATKSNL